MSLSRAIPDHNRFLWSFEQAQGELEQKQYIKSYYHHLDKALDFHMHDFYEINIVTSGTGKHIIEQRELLAQRGDVFIIPPFVGHGYLCAERMTVYHLLLSHSFMASFAPFLERLPGYRMLFDIEPLLRGRLEHPFFLHADGEAAELIRHHISLIDATIGEESEALLHTLSLIATLTGTIKTPLALGATTLAPERTLSLIESMEYIQKHFDEHLSPRDLASRCAMSYSTYLRSFKTLTGQTPSDYLLSCRIKSAERLLRSSDESILSIALSCGFFDSSHFIREFTKCHGFSPGAFRKQ